MLRRNFCSLLAFVVTLASLPAQTTRPADLLIGKARALEARGRGDLAAQTWQQLLMIEPEQQDALAGLARLAKLNGKSGEAEGYLAKLRKLNPASPALKQVETLTKGNKRIPELEEAIRLAQAGKSDQAIAAYRKTSEGKPAPAEWSASFYETLAASPQGYESATAGLEESLRQNPRAEDVKLALGKIYTYRPALRIKGLSLLQSIQGVLASQAKTAWKQGLIWEEGSGRSVASMREYVSRYPDAELDALLKKPQRTGPSEVLAGGEDVQKAYQALRANKIEAAETLFRKALADSPKLPSAMAGLGFVAMKQEKFDDAVTNFEAALALAPANRVFRDAELEARFWGAMQRGAQLLKEGNGVEAAKNFKEAIEKRPTNIEALSGYSGALMMAGEYSTAIPVIERVVKADSSRQQAWSDLVQAKFNTASPESALLITGKIPPAVSAKLKGDAAYVATLSSVLYAAGRTNEARTMFSQATALESQLGVDPLVGLLNQFAALSMRFGDPISASKRYRSALAKSPTNLDAWEGYLLSSNQINQAKQALQTLATLPASVHAEAQARPSFLRAVAALEARVGNLTSAEGLLKQAREIESSKDGNASFPTELQLAQVGLEQGKGSQSTQRFLELTEANPENPEAWRGLVLSLKQSGAYDQARETLRKIPARVASILEGDADFVTSAAAIYKETASSDEALQYLRTASARFAEQGRSVPTAMSLQLAWLMLDSPGSERDLFVLLRNLKTRTDVSSEQKKTLDSIWAAWVMRSAEKEKLAGSAERAVDLIEAGLRIVPYDQKLQRALATTLVAAGDAVRAVSVFKTAGMRDALPGEFHAAIGAASMAEDNRSAGEWLKQGLTKYPKDSELLSIAGRQAASKGDFKKAEAFWRLALKGVDAQSREKNADVLRSGPEAISDLTVGDPVDDTGTLLLRAADANSSPAVEPSSEPFRSTLPWAVNDSGGQSADRLLAQLSLQPERPEPVLTSSLTPVAGPQMGVKNVAPTSRPSFDLLLDRLKTPEAPKPVVADMPRLAAPSVRPQETVATPPNVLVSMLLEPSVKRSAPERDKIMDQIRTVESANSPFLGFGGVVQSRSGQAGFERLTVQQSTLESSTVLGNGLRATVVARSVFADSSTPDGESLLRYGMLPLGDTFEAPSANGLAGEVQLSGRDFGLRFGSTPRGFLVQNLVGGFRVRPGGGPITLSFDRDSVKDTMVSYAGARDPLTQRVWGGVIANTASAGANWGSAKSGAYFNAGFQHITGNSVQTNRRVDGTMGAYWRLAETRAGKLSAGLNLFAMHYDKNLRFFTVGHGGYFSPQRFLLFNAPITWTGKAKRFDYTVSTSIGSQSFTEELSPFFPVDAAIQGKTGPYYPKLSSSGVNYNMDFRGAYQLTENWFLVGFLNVNNARFYSQHAAGVSIKYSFRPRPFGADVVAPSIPDWLGRQPFGTN